MNSTMRRALVVASAVAAAPGAAEATNGYFSHGWGTKSKAMAGVATALPQDTLATAVNPAGMAFVGDGLDLGVSFFSPSDRGYTANDDFVSGNPLLSSVTPGTYTSSLDWFVIPSFGYNRVLNERMTLGIAVFANGGMNTEYEDRPVWENFTLPIDPKGTLTATTPTGVNLEQLFVEVPFSYKLNARHAIGIAPVFAVQRFEANGLEPFRAASLHPDSVTNNGHDWSYGGGIHIGWLGRPTDRLSLGASYRSRLWMTEFDEYKGLFADGGDFDVPAMLNLGLAFEATPTLTLAFDYQRIFYSDIKAIANPNDIAIQSCFIPWAKSDICLGGQAGLGFGWEDMDVFKLGASWDYDAAWTFRGGVSYASEFAPSGQALFNVLAPATIRWHFTLGATYRHSAKDEFNFSFAYMPEEELEGQNPRITGSQTGSVFMEQRDIELSWTHRF
ncbi:OmpP1/FadL family transporter [Thiococcus pfennigii]|uniref:OmpP1/FadL family transporter n=1 Tax=Thiococcus pfennigii TaxID=1057 RepID=UPI001904EFDE|nr:outer membrane protein transport protein [Thiococcus pfennigii]MBK1702723.1 hydrocarbon degradation protein [Thiococcus pfennigii]MBK1731066.1 hydrocarbon degradation protein [Thiococcus pfennigii]